MTLPFNDGSTREYVCFCCGLSHTSLQEYKEHIIENHEEGREWVRCPLARCGFPIRDTSVHMKKYHPHDKIPPGCQMRALIWSDQRDPRKKKRKVEFKTGDFISMKNGGAKFHYRSGWEFQVYECLEVLDEVVAYTGEKIEIDYYLAGEKHRYFPDMIVQFSDNTFEVWEIKPSSQTAYDVNKAKWAAAEEYCRVRNWKFKVVTEKNIRELKKKAGILPRAKRRKK